MYSRVIAPVHGCFAEYKWHYLVWNGKQEEESSVYGRKNSHEILAFLSLDTSRSDNLLDKAYK